MRESIYSFFEHPKGFLPNFIQGIIIILILISVVTTGIEFFYNDLFLAYQSTFQYTEYFILGVFTVEYLLRLVTAPKLLKFAVKPLSLVDLIAIAPNYIEFFFSFFINTTGIRAIRLVRFIRFSRVLRLLKVLKYKSIIKKALQYQDTVLEEIIPVIVFFILLKLGIWFFESEGLWIQNTNLGGLFTIMGFALGIILSQKIGASYDKFLQVGNTLIRMYATLKTIAQVIDKLKPQSGTRQIKEWAKNFLTILRDHKADNFRLDRENEKLYKLIAQVESPPAYITSFYLSLCQDAVFCLSKKIRFVPKPYDNLLHQATLFYLALIAIFTPGLTGLISVVVATYILYGMYYLTQDLDDFTSGEYSLININVSELEHLANL